MGNYLGLPTNDSNEEIDELKKRLSNLENIDRNGDGKLSNEEMDIWINNHKKDLIALEKSIDDKYQKIIQENQDYRKQISELECHVDTLTVVNEQLKNELKNIRENELDGVTNVDTSNKLKISEASKIRINEFVDELLNDKNVNIKYLPDFVEKQIYRNVFNILVNLLDNVFETASVEFLGHKLTFDINPSDKNQVLKQDLDKDKDDDMII